MTKSIDGRLEKIEDRLTISEDQRARIEQLTRQANLKRVSNIVLMEEMLSILENAVFPDEPSKKPGFVEQEVTRQVSQREIDQASSKTYYQRLSDSRLQKDALQVLDDFAESVRNYLHSDDEHVPYQFSCHPEWDAQAFLDRWERVRQKWIQDVDTQGVE